MKKRESLTTSQFNAKKVEPDGLTIKDVLVIECGPAKGHYAVKRGNQVVGYDAHNPDHAKLPRLQITIDEAMLQQVVDSGNARPEIKCKLNHGDSAGDVVGGYTNFRVVGNQVRADLKLMSSSPHREYVVELASRFAGEVGNSIDFDYTYEQSSAQPENAVARCRKLNSVDLVDSPAATNSLFEEQHKTPNSTFDMPLSPEDLDALSNLMDKKLDARFSTLKTEQAEHFTQINTRFEAVEKKVDEALEDEDDDEEKKKAKELEAEDEKKKEELAAIASKAALKAIHDTFPKVKLASIGADPGNGGGKETFETAIASAMTAGAKSRGEAIAFVARNKPDIYNAHREGRATA